MATQQEIIDAITLNPGIYVSDLAKLLGCVVVGKDGYTRASAGLTIPVLSLQRWNVVRGEKDASGKRKGQKRLYLTGEKR